MRSSGRVDSKMVFKLFQHLMPEILLLTARSIFDKMDGEMDIKLDSELDDKLKSWLNLIGWVLGSFTACLV